MTSAQELLTRIRRWTIFFIAGVVISGATAIPITTQLAFATQVMGEDFSAGGTVPGHVSAWLRTVRDGVQKTKADAPFLFYGTDWLAFGHFVVALAFVGVVRDPVRNRWLYQFGMFACVLVPIWAFIFGAVRGIPVWWRIVDSSVGALGFIPLWLCNRWARSLELRGRRVTDQ